MALLPDAASSYWMTSTPPTSYPALAADVEVEVAVVGAGIAGLSTAWELTQTGRSVAVLEAGRVAADVTGHTTAKLTAQHSLIYDHLTSSFGADAARLYAASQQDAVEHVARAAAALDIDCELERLAAYTYTESTDQVEQIHAEAAAAQRAGLPARFTTETGLPFLVAGAVRVDDQAQFHPRRYLLALADDLIRRGGRIFEQTRVTDLDEGEPCRLGTEAGPTVTARHVVVATHYPIFDRALLFSRLTPRRELVVAAVIADHRDPAGMYLTTEDNTRSVRTAPYGRGQRLLIVTGEHFRPGSVDTREHLDRLADWTRRRFGVEAISHFWAAQDNDTTDRLPYVGRFHAGTDHVWVATGFGGWGMSNGVMAGRLLAAMIAGERLPWAELYDPRRIHPTVESVSFVKANLEVAKHFIGDRLHTRPAAALADLPRGHGQVIRLDGERCAVYRDDDGKSHAVSATCTHLGCTVGFNEVERTWDCPCHGSRFHPDGSVIHGPATQPLQPRAIGE
ncbi:FAD-dependent oxidoreductase [Micromonospora sp. H33]|uniref:FAD-dependent oxidoreductase n=1 Tax=Micromonospora sp. H33 TaxID=3452215 RepID=UPI003F898EE5